MLAVAIASLQDSTGSAELVEDKMRTPRGSLSTANTLIINAMRQSAGPCTFKAEFTDRDWDLKQTDTTGSFNYCRLGRAVHLSKSEQCPNTPEPVR